MAPHPLDTPASPPPPPSPAPLSPRYTTSHLARRSPSGCLRPRSAASGKMRSTGAGWSCCSPLGSQLPASGSRQRLTGSTFSPLGTIPQWWVAPGQGREGGMRVRFKAAAGRRSCGWWAVGRWMCSWSMAGRIRGCSKAAGGGWSLPWTSKTPSHITLWRWALQAPLSIQEFHARRRSLQYPAIEARFALAEG